jgi:uncharacterized repeat protein (TIGR03803 family)
MQRSRLVVASGLFAVLHASVASAASQTILYSFKGTTDGALPFAGLLADTAGNLYGTLTQGGSAANGAVFKLTPPTKANKPWSKKLLYSFKGGPKDGADPQGGLIADSLGNLYGTTVGGGTGFGTAYELEKPAPGKTAWKEKVLHIFKGGAADGSMPDGALLLGADGNFYGTTSEGGGGGATTCVVSTPVYCGTVFKLSPPAPGKSAWAEKVLYSFVGGANDAAVPRAALIANSNGTLFGTTQYGGPFDFGTVFSLTPPAGGHGAWAEFVLLYLPAGEGTEPQGNLLMDKFANLYGTSNESVFEVGAGDQYTVLHHFQGPDGSFPGYAGLIADASFNLYSTTSAGGLNSNNGTIFEMTPPAGGQTTWTQTVLHTFAGGPTDGQTPYAPLIMDATGALYGTTFDGGTDNFGAVFKFVP